MWGHSDGAIIALLLALGTPHMVAGVIAEATHFYKRKPRSRAFFESMRNDPRTLGDTVTTVLARDHGERWPEVIERHSRAWQRIAEEAASDTEDFYGGRLGEIAVPALVLHGARDPRTEPGEIEALETRSRATVASAFRRTRSTVRLKPDPTSDQEKRESYPARGRPQSPQRAGDGRRRPRIALAFIDGIQR